MRTGRIIALIVGTFLTLIALALLFGAAAIGVATAIHRDDGGYYEVILDRIESDTAAVVSDDLTFDTDPAISQWALEVFDVDVRLAADSAVGADVFVGIARSADVDEYLAGVAHEVVVEVDGDDVVLRPRAGRSTVEPPGSETFWAEQAEGSGTQVIEWEARGGRWTAVVMNADGAPGVAADVVVGARSGLIVPIGFTLLGVGLMFLFGGVALIVFGAVGLRRPDDTAEAQPLAPGEQSSDHDGVTRSPVLLEGRLDPDVSRWQWLVKWLLVLPHIIILAFLWLAMSVLTIIAGFAILFTGRYPRSLFDFDVGVLRWTWRVVFYAFSGGLGTDQYPPFTLADDAAYPARLDVRYPERLSRGLVLVKWWLLAIPHYIVLGLLWGGSTVFIETDGDATNVVRVSSAGLLGVLTMIAAIALLFRGRHLKGLFDLIVGLNRWAARVVAYTALMTDTYPPFRLDQGELDPAAGDPDRIPDPAPAATTSWDPPSPGQPS